MKMTRAVDYHPKNIHFDKGIYSPRTVVTAAAAATAQGLYNNGTTLCCSGSVFDDGNDL